MAKIQTSWRRPSTWPWLAIAVGVAMIVGILLAIMLTQRGLRGTPAADSAPWTQSPPSEGV